MGKAMLYLMVGYPGSGKTTVSHIIHELTGAVHIWADRERQIMFGDPTHSHTESRTLYDELNKRADELLAAGRSVIFDTNFNFRRDRDYLRRIASGRQAGCQLIWIRTPKDLALSRAQHPRHAATNRYGYILPTEDFERMASHLEPPEADEDPILLDGTIITADYVAGKLQL